ncbi:nuclear transport factor 2 family protein [Mesorhizobium sp. 10J20-29]
MAIFVNGGAISLIGTGADELCSDRAAVASVFKRNFRDATASRFEWGWKDVAIYGDTAAVAIALVIHLTVDNEAIKVPVRWTVSLVRTSEGWRWIVDMRLSPPSPKTRAMPIQPEKGSWSAGLSAQLLTGPSSQISRHRQKPDIGIVSTRLNMSSDRWEDDIHECLSFAIPLRERHNAGGLVFCRLSRVARDLGPTCSPITVTILRRSGSSGSCERP